MKEGKDFLGRWYERYLSCKEGENFLEDKRRSGRPKKLDDVAADKCAKEFKKKIPVHGKRRHYKSVEEVGTWQLPCTGGQNLRLSAMRPPRASFPCTQSRVPTAAALHAGLPEEHIPQERGGAGLCARVLMAPGAREGQDTHVKEGVHQACIQ